MKKIVVATPDKFQDGESFIVVTETFGLHTPCVERFWMEDNLGNIRKIIKTKKGK